MSRHDLFPLALAAFQSGNVGRAQQICTELVKGQTDHDRAHFLLGLMAHQRGNHQEALERISRAVGLNPSMAGYHANLAPVLLALGRFDDAIGSARQALRLQPIYPEASLNLGNALLTRGEVDAAIEAYRNAIQHSPQDPGAGSLSVAAKAQNNLGHALHLRGNLDEAIAILRELLTRHPGVAEFHVNLANALKDHGLIEDAVAEYRAATRAAPADAGIGSAMLYSLWFHPGMSPREIYQEHAAWSRRHADPLRDPRPHENDRDPQRRLRVGYLSPYFRGHVSGLLLEPVLAHHDHQQFELFCYSTTFSPDEVTQRLQSHSDVWRDLAGLSDEALAQQIRADRIDILVDVTAHMDGNRALVLARKPAPVQVNYLAYPATSGMSAMDYRITCAWLDPQTTLEDDASNNSEQLMRVPNTFWCYGPLATSPAVNELPAPSNGTFTFASLNSFSKINGQVIELWCEVLQAVPNSRLMILVAGGEEGNRTIAPRFQRHGVEANRLRFVDRQPRDQYLSLFNEADLSLDPFPYNGHTTSLDSLWMGVPFVTLAGNSPISRAGACILGNVGLSDFVAMGKQRYLELCVELAGDLPRLASIRRSLRERMQESPLTDAAVFTRNLESAYRRMWHSWTQSTG